MEYIEQRIEEAQQNNKKLNNLLEDYLPFIKKQVSGMLGCGLEYDDMLSISMLVFSNCVHQYQTGRGNFMALVQVSIKNRLIDEGRREQRNRTVIPLGGVTREEEMMAAEYSASIQQYDKEREHQDLCWEISDLTVRLGEFDITFGELAKICPKQSRARLQCYHIAHAVVMDEGMRTFLLKFKKVPQIELAKQFQISAKTIEKHRKYIVALVILLTGDYPGIQAFLPLTEEVGI